MSDIARLRGQCERALLEAGGLMTLDDLIGLAKAGKVQLWSNDDADALIATEIMTYPRRTILNAFMAAGELRSIRALYPAVETFARAHDCAVIVCAGRPGWGRVGRAGGWQLHAMVFVKNLLRPN